MVEPVQYIGEEKLSWPAVLKAIGYVLWRMFSTKFTGGPRYLFGAKFPRHVVVGALEKFVEHGMSMPTNSIIPFELEAITSSVKLLTTHRAKGRIVIDFR